MNRIIICCLLFCLPFLSNAQDFEIGIMVGASGYSGDLNPKSNSLTSGKQHFSLGIFGRKDINRFLAGRVGFTYGKVSGDDARAESLNRQSRNLSFESDIRELSLIGEFNPLFNNSSGAPLKPYIFGGIAVFNFNPKANYQGQSVELQSLGTEGQGMDNFASPYGLTQVSIPFGAGTRYAVTENLNIGLEVGLRFTFTDYLDDISGTYVNYNELLQGNGQLAAALGNRQGELLNGEPVILPTGEQRGSSDQDDYYFMAGLTLSYTFSNGNATRGNRNGKALGCPSNF